MKVRDIPTLFSNDVAPRSRDVERVVCFPATEKTKSNRDAFHVFLGFFARVPIASFFFSTYAERDGVRRC